MDPASTSRASHGPGSFISLLIYVAKQRFYSRLCRYCKVFDTNDVYKKIGTKRLCRNSEVITILRCCNWEVALYFTRILINVNKVRPSQHSAHRLYVRDLTALN